MIYRAHQLEIITTSQYQYLMRQISRLGWKTKEPEDKPYEYNTTLLQEAISLLFSEGEFTPSTFMNALKNKGIVLRREEVEDLLALARDSLKDEEQRVKLINIKSRSKEDNI
jgi:hypothetical protein